MGILNITPDSFFDGGAYNAPELAVKRALELQAQGADIIDIGAHSTRPGSVALTPQEELARLLPVLKVLRGQLRVPVSVDTFYPQVAKLALEHGAAIINDVSGKLTGEMAQIIKDHSAGWVLMHNNGGADATPAYSPDVVTCVRKYLHEMVEQAMQFGIAREQLCVDPGIGFGKTHEDNLKLIAHTARLKVDGIALLVGASRKRVTGAQQAPAKRLGGTVAAHVIAQLGGANVLRVHDVELARQAADFIECVIMP